MANIDELSSKIVVDTSQATKSINRLATSLTELSSALNRIETGKLLEIGNSFNRIGQAATTLKGSGTTINQLAKGLDKLGTVNTAQISTVATALNSLTSSVGASSLNASTVTNIVSLASALKSFGSKTTSNASVNMSSLASGFVHFVTTINSAGSVTINLTQLAELSKAIRSFGSKNMGSAITNMPRLADAVVDMIRRISTAPSVSGKLVSLVSALSQFKSRTISIPSATNNASNGIKKLGRSATFSLPRMRSLTSMIGLFYAKMFLVIRAVKLLWKSIESSMGYFETVNYFQAAYGQVAEKAVSQWREAGYSSAEEYYNSFSERSAQLTAKMSGYEIDVQTGRRSLNENLNSLGMNPSQLMQYQAVFAQMASSIGLSSENALKLSNALTELGADLASVKNLDFDQVWGNLASGDLAGMSRAMDKYGTNIRATAIDQRLLAMGIDATYQTLSAQDKVLMRTLITLDSTRYAWGDLSDTLESPANALRRLKARFQTLGMTIGDTFLGAITKVMPFINAMAMSLEKLFVWVQSLLGIDASGLVSSLTQSPDITEMLESLEDAEDGVNDVTEAVEELKNSLTSIDEAVVLPSADDVSSKNNSVDVTANSKAIQEAFDKIYAEYQKVWDEAYAKVDDTSLALANKMYANFAPLQKLISDIAIGDWLAVGNDTSNLSHGLFTFINKSLENVNWSGIASGINSFVTGYDFVQMAIDTNRLGRNVYNSLHTMLTELDWKLLGSSISDYVVNIDWFGFSSNLSQIIIDIETALTDAIDGVDWEKVGEGFGELLKGVKWKELAESTWKLLKSALKAVAKAWLGAMEDNPLEVGILSMLVAMKLTGAGNIIFGKISGSMTSGIATSGLTGVGTLIGETIVAGVVAYVSYNFGNMLYEALTGDETFKEYGSLTEQWGIIFDTIETGEWRDAVNEMMADMVGQGNSDIDGFFEDIWKPYYDEFNNHNSSSHGGVYNRTDRLKQQWIDEQLKETGDYSPENIAKLSKYYDDVIKNAKTSSEATVSATQFFKDFNKYVADNPVWNVFNSSNLSGVQTSFANILKLFDSEYSDNSFAQAIDVLGNKVDVSKLTPIWNVFSKTFTDVTSLGGMIGKLIGGKLLPTTMFDNIKNFFATGATNTANTIGGLLGKMFGGSQVDGNIFTNVKNFFNGTSGDGTTTFGGLLGKVFGNTTVNATNYNPIKTFFSGNAGNGVATIGGVLGKVFGNATVNTTGLNGLKTSLNAGITTGSTVGGILSNIFKGNSGISSWWNNTSSYFTSSKWSGLFNNVKTGMSTGWNSVTSWWGLNGASKWKQTQVDPYFSATAWSYPGMKNGLSTGITSALTAMGTKLSNFFSELKITSGSVSNLIAKITVPQKFATGGFIEDGLFTMNRGEIAGKFDNGKSVVANNMQIIDGISYGVESANQPLLQVMQEQNMLLRQILAKDNGITKDGVFNSVRQSAIDYVLATGMNPFPV